MTGRNWSVQQFLPHAGSCRASFCMILFSLTFCPFIFLPYLLSGHNSSTSFSPLFILPLHLARCTGSAVTWMWRTLSVQSDDRDNLVSFVYWPSSTQMTYIWPLTARAVGFIIVWDWKSSRSWRYADVPFCSLLPPTSGANVDDGVQDCRQSW